MNFKKLTCLLLAAAILTAATLTGCDETDKDKAESSDDGVPAITDEPAANDEEMKSYFADYPEDVPPEYDDLKSFTGYKAGSDCNDSGNRKGVDAAFYVSPFNYEGIEIPYKSHALDDGEVEGELDYIRQEYPTEKITIDPRPIEDGDKVNLDYVGSVDGVEFDGGNSKANGNTEGADVVAGSSDFIDDFLTQIIGHSPGETFDVNVTFPDDYSSRVGESAADLDGKEAVFVVTINYIYKDGPMDDAYIEKHFSEEFGLKTVQQMKDYIADMLLSQRKEEFILGYIDENSQVGLPIVLLKQDAEEMINYYRDSAVKGGYDSFKKYLEENGVEGGLRGLVEKFHEDNVKMLKRQLAIQFIAEQQGITITPEAIKEWLSEVHRLDDYDQSVEEYGVPFLARSVMQAKVVDFIFDKGVKMPQGDTQTGAAPE